MKARSALWRNSVPARRRTQNELSDAQDAKEKQSTSGSADASHQIQESVNGNPVLVSDSQQDRALHHHPKDPAMVTATA